MKSQKKERKRKHFFFLLFLSDAIIAVVKQKPTNERNIEQMVIFLHFSFWCFLDLMKMFELSKTIMNLLGENNLVRQTEAELRTT